MRSLGTKPYFKNFLITILSIVFAYLLSSGPVIGLILNLESKQSASPDLLATVASPYAPLYRLAMNSTSTLGKCLCLYVNVWVPADEELSGRVFGL
jgi:hypothetical protein